MYKHNIKFVPIGVSPDNTKSMKSAEFVYDSLDKSEVKKKAYSSSKNIDIDEYALRNHWSIFECEVKYANKPWDTFNELCGEIISIKQVNSWKLIENKLTILIDSPSNVSSVINELNSYYSGFNINKIGSDIITIETEPRYN